MASGESDGQWQITPPESRWAYWRRVLRPLYWWLLLVLLMYGYRLHQRTMEHTRIGFTVSLQGKDASFEAMARLDGQPVVNGEKISLGRHTFTVTHPKAVTFSTNFFGWYGGRDFGQIHLERTLGTLKLSASPPAQTITLTGPEFSTTLHAVTITNFTVPTDSYAVHAEYPHWSQSQTVSVSADQTATAGFAPRLGALQITCNKDAATYRLEFASGKLVDSGDLPATVTGLPVGSYQMTVGYHNQQIQKSVLVEAGMTNEATVQFVLGAAHIESEPSGAEVRDAEGASLGQTPLDVLDLKPQLMQFNLSLSDYQPVSFALEITADQTNSCRTNLVSLRYLSAMRQARQFMATGSYNLVAQAVREALDVKPGDAEALQLQTQASGIVKADQERLERLKRPQQVFDALCVGYADSGLFADYELRTGKRANDVADAIVKSLRAEPSAFAISVNNSTQPDTYRIVAKQEFSLGILGGSQRLCLIVVGQAKDDETQIRFRVLEYQIQHTVEATGLLKFSDNKQMIPVHSSRMEMNEVFQRRIREGVRLVTQKIQQAINP